MNSNADWSQSFDDWRNGSITIKPIQKQLKHFRRIGIDLILIQESLATLHSYLDKHLLHPDYLPISLLLEPAKWNPSKNGIQQLPLLLQHRNLSSISELLSSGTLNNILNGDLSLYGDLPPIPIRAYAEGLNRQHRRLRREKQISLLEHLATDGWEDFRRKIPVSTGLDRYHPAELPSIPLEIPQTDDLLLVFDGSENNAQFLAVEGGWNKHICCSLTSISSLPQLLSDASGIRVSICHATDIISNRARHFISNTLNKAPIHSLLTCDDIIIQQRWSDGSKYEHRQFRSSISNIRLYSRGGVGGLLTLPLALLKQCSFAPSYTCLEAFRLDILLQLTCRTINAVHCNQALVKCSSSHNPYVPEQGWPAERCPFNEKQLEEINHIRCKHASQYFGSENTLSPNILQAGCHELIHPIVNTVLVSILIPFRDKVQLTKNCVRSIQSKAGSTISYEIILIDNGSVEEETRDWIAHIKIEKNIQYLFFDEEFNYSKLHNRARKICNGSHLLFLNNDIEIVSENFLNKLLDPFIHPKIVAVGSRLHYPDMSIQHQGVIIVP